MWLWQLGIRVGRIDLDLYFTLCITISRYIRVKQEVREGGWIDGAQIFKTVKTTLYDTIMVGTCQCMSKPIEYTTLGMNPNLNCGLWMIMLCQCSFTDCNKCNKMMLDVSGKLCMWGDKGVYGNFLYVLLNFAVNLILFQNIKFIY